MPLKKTPGKSYLHRERIFIDPYLDDTRVNEDGKFDSISVDVSSHPQNVASIETTNFSFPQSLAPPFVFPTSSQTGSHTLDVRLTDYPAAANSLDFSVTLPSIRYDSISDQMSELETLLEDAMDAESDPNFNTGAANVSFTVIDSQTFLNTGNVGAIVIYAEFASTPDTISLYWLFGSGANTNDAPNIQLGFPTKLDVGGPQTINGTFITYPMPITYWKIYPHRYVNVNLRETPELKPHSRIWLTRTDDFRRLRRNVANVRLLTKPIRRLDTLNIDIRLPGDLKTNAISNQGYDLTFDILLVSPEIHLPDWLYQYLPY